MRIRMTFALLATSLALYFAPTPATRARGTPQCVQKPPGLVSWWRGEGNADDTIGTNNGIELDGVRYAPGIVGQAFAFDGLSYVEASTAGLPTRNANRTIELWANITSQLTVESYFAGYGDYSSYNGADTHTYHVGAVSDERAFFSQWGGGSAGGRPLVFGRWYHVAVTNEGDSFRLYVDGRVVASSVATINTPATETHFYIGRIPGPLGIQRQLNGLVDEISVYNRALSTAEIRAIYQAGAAGKCFDSNAIPVIINPVYNDGRLSLSSDGSNIDVGAVIDVSGGTLADTESFLLKINKAGTKWLVKKASQSSPGGLPLSDALPAHTTVTLIVRNPNGAESAPVEFSR